MTGPPDPYALPGWHDSKSSGTWWPAINGTTPLKGDLHFQTLAMCQRWCDDYNHKLPLRSHLRVMPITLPFTTQADHG